MAKHANIIKLSVLAGVIFLSFACRKVFKKAEWAPEAAFPLAYTDLTYYNLVTDTTNIVTDSTGFASMVFEQQLDSISLDVLDTFSAPPFYRNFKLDSLRLEVPEFLQRITVGQLARQLQASGDQQQALIGGALLSLHGKTIASNALLSFLVPSTIEIPFGSIPIDLNQFFQSAELRSGTVLLKIDNRFPMNINQLDFDVSNASDNTVLLQEAGLKIPKNTTFTKSYDLAGKTVEGQLNANIAMLELLTDKNVIIDTNQFIEISMGFKDLQVISATAIFPDQDVVSDYQAAALEDMGEMELREALIQEGNVVMEVTSTLQDSIFMTYSMPKTTQNGVPLLFNGVVPPAPPGGSTTITLKVPVENYNLNLSSPPDYFNRFVYDFKAHVKYTGKKVYLSLNDSIEVNVYMKSIRPRYVRGYLGSLDTTFSSSIETDVFSKIKADAFSPAQVDVKLKVTNGLGVAGLVNFDYLKASNPNGQTVEARDDNMIGVPLVIGAATDPPFRETVTTIQSSPGSNFPDLISIFPTRFEYRVKATVGGLPKDTNSFVYNTSKLKPKLEINVPLNLAVQGLLLRDTIGMDPSQIGFENSGGSLALIAYNGFPFSARIKAIFISSSGQQLVLQAADPMLAADVDPSTGRAVGKKYSKVTLPFTEADLYHITQSQQVIIEAKFDTPSGQKVKIYTDYTAQLTLTTKVVPKLSR